MDLVWGVFSKRLSDLRSEEMVLLSLIVAICVLVVIYAVALVVRLSGKMEPEEEFPAVSGGLLRKGIFGSHREARTGHSD